MRNDDMWGCLYMIGIAGCCIGCLIAIFGAGQAAEREAWKREAVARGVAGYDEQTGEWKWTVERNVAGE